MSAPDAKKPARKRTPARKPQTRGLLLIEMRFKKDFRCFRRNRKLKFRPGVNLLVGDQGAGKSTVLKLIADLSSRFDADHSRQVAQFTAEDCRLLSFDFEKQNPRTLSYFVDGAIGAQISSKFQSHGEVVRSLLSSLGNAPKDSKLRKLPALILLDEPDMALSPRSAHELARNLGELAAAGHQILAAVHNPIVISSQPEVFSLEHGRWMTSDKFLASHAEPVPDVD